MNINSIRMGRTRLIWVVLCCHFVLIGGAFAQKNKKQKDTPGDDLAKRAGELFGQGDYVAAYPLYSQLLSLEEHNTAYNFRFGVCELFAGKDKEKAIAYLKFAAGRPDAPDEALFYLGRAYHLNYRFNDALGMYYRYREKAGASASRKLDVDRHIEMCHNGRSLLMEIRDLVVMDKKEVREDDFFRSFETNERFGGRILPKPDEFKSKNDVDRGDRSVVFMAADRSEVYFSGYGESSGNRDIFRVTKTVTGEWGNPENLGSVINTPYDEAYPYLHPNGRTLYFASKGHNSMGGYDVFLSVYNEEQRRWSEPKNLDFAINSPADDILYMPDANDSVAFFASNRASVGGMIAVYKIRVDRMPVTYSAGRRKDITGAVSDTLALDTDILKQKALLEVNATPELLAQLEESKTKAAGDGEIIPDTLAADDAGLKEAMEAYENLSEEDIINLAYKDADRLMNEAREARRQANTAALLAEQKRTEAVAQEQQAQALLDGLERTGDAETKAEKQKDADALLSAAGYNHKQAAVALRMSGKLDSEADQKQQEADQALANAKVIEEAVKSNSTAEAIEILATQKARLEETGGEKTGDPTSRQADEYVRLSAEKQEEANETMAYAEALDKDAYDDEKDAVILREEADKTKDSRIKAELLSQAVELEETAERKKEEAGQSKQKAEQLSREVQVMREEAELAGNIAGEIRVMEQAGDVGEPQATEQPVVETRTTGLRQEAVSKKTEPPAGDTPLAVNTGDSGNDTGEAPAEPGVPVNDDADEGKDGRTTPAVKEPAQTVEPVPAQATGSRPAGATVPPSMTKEELRSEAQRFQSEISVAEQRQEAFSAENEALAEELNVEFESLARARGKDKENEILERMDAIKRRQETNQKTIQYTQLKSDLLREETNAHLAAAGEAPAYENNTAGKGSAEQRRSRMEALDEAIALTASADSVRNEAGKISNRAAAARSQEEKEALFSESIALENDATDKEARAGQLFTQVFESRLSGEPVVFASAAPAASAGSAGDQEAADRATGETAPAQLPAAATVKEKNLGLKYDDNTLKAVVSDAEYANYSAFVSSAVRKKQDSGGESDNAARLRKESGNRKQEAARMESKAASMPEGDEKRAVMEKARVLRQQAAEYNRQARAALALANQHDEEANDNLYAAEAYIGRLNEEKYNGSIAEGKAAEPVASSKPAVQPVASTDTTPAAPTDTTPAAPTDTSPAASTDTKPPVSTGGDTQPADIVRKVETGGDVSVTDRRAEVTAARTTERREAATAPAGTFSIGTVSSYTDARPIPVDQPLPQGVMFKVQVGAFRNPIPQNLFRGISPVAGETAPGNLIRYTAGLFKGYEPADNAKNMIRAMGFRDAFVVAFYNGERISVAEARALLDKQDATGNETYKAEVKKELDALARVDVPETETATQGSRATPVAPVQEAPVEGDLATMKGLLYTVQVGVYSRTVSSADLFNIQPIYSERLPNGNIRYTTGIYSAYQEAATNKDRVVALGVTDAFIVAYRNGARVPLSEARGTEGAATPAPPLPPQASRTVIVVPDEAEISVSEFERINPLETGVVFRVQIGAYRNKAPSEVVNFWIDRLKQKITSYRTESGITLFTVGELVNYEAARALRDDLEQQGMGDIFVTAYENGVPVSIQRAIDLTSE